ncbi:MAG: class I SAM-dependent DNA methyltransferase [Candidatus Microsaccharimonas sp.]
MTKIQNEFKKIDNILFEDAGTSGASDYLVQISWILFLKYLDDLEDTRNQEAVFSSEAYEPLFKEEFRWDSWASPKKADGSFDLTAQLTGDDLVGFVNDQLFPYLKQFKNAVQDPKSLLYKIGEIFGEVTNKIQSGQNLREVIDIVDKLEFKTQDELDDLSVLYEDRLKLLGGAGRSGEFYTPRPLIQAIIAALDIPLYKTIYDGAAGTAGFLTESYVYLRKKAKTPSDLRFLNQETLYGKNKKPDPYLLGTMNMIIHGIESPNMEHTNTLAEDTQDIQERDRFDYILANPPFGGDERAEVQRNFKIKTSETANMFLQHFMKRLRVGGEAAVIIKNTFLTNEANGATGAIRRELIENFNLHTILDLPSGVFRANSSTGVKTVVLFFRKGEPTKDIFYYQLNLTRNLGKTSPLIFEDMIDFVDKFKSRVVSLNSWIVNADAVNKETLDLGVNNPNAPQAELLKSPHEILSDIKLIDQRIFEILDEIEL